MVRLTDMGRAHFDSQNLLLASRSPRRRTLLTDAGIPFKVIDSGVDDAQLSPGHVDPAAWAAALAFLKADGARRQLDGATDAILLGADTIVVKDGHVVGQPRDEADARRILELLENGSHLVISGLALIDNRSGHRFVTSDTARVQVGEIGEFRIAEYLASGEWRGKAGAYNLSERIDAGWPISCEGDPATVMGLPIRLLRQALGAV